MDYTHSAGWYIISYNLPADSPIYRRKLPSCYLQKLLTTSEILGWASWIMKDTFGICIIFLNQISGYFDFSTYRFAGIGTTCHYLHAS